MHDARPHQAWVPPDTRHAHAPVQITTETLFQFLMSLQLSFLLTMIQRYNDTPIQQYNNTTIQLFTTFAFTFNFQQYNDTALYNFCLCFCFLLSNHSRFKISAFVQLLLLTFALALFPFDIAIFPLWLRATFFILFPVWLLWPCISLNHQALFFNSHSFLLLPFNSAVN